MQAARAHSATVQCRAGYWKPSRGLIDYKLEIKNRRRNAVHEKPRHGLCVMALEHFHGSLGTIRGAK
jgi:hypothetical protein